ncbi:lectin [Massilia sp. DWR3-1-1]|uniref:lectin n=1 Tax=Massilia sp. DWR3-1-1 TaxID=2804559 RepID=UPI003CF90698
MMKKFSTRVLLIAGLLLAAPAAWSQDLPQITPSLKKLLGSLPIAGMKDDVDKLVGSLKKTSCGGALTGCYATRSGPLQLYFFTSGSAQQTFLLVVNKTMTLPPLLKPNVQKILGQTAVSDPIISISTTDYVLDVAKMPADLQQVVRNSYFNVGSLTFSSGVQLAARANIGGVMMTTLNALGVPANQMTLRAGVVMPIPTDLASGAGSGAGLAEALRHGDTMKKAGADAAKLKAFVEFQPAPALKISMTVPAMTLSDSTFFLDNELVFGYKGNARFANTSKDILLQFQTPLTPEGAMDLVDFSFRMATPQILTLTDTAFIAMAMAMPQAAMATSATTTALDKFGGGYVGNIKVILQPLSMMTKALSVIQLRNPVPPAPYRFGDASQPFPASDAPFNLLLLGPLADGGPLLYMAGDVRILGQTMGKMAVSVGKSGFQGTAQENVTLKLGPLGNTKIKLLATADISSKAQTVSVTGNIAGQQLLLALAGDTMSVALSASCINPFEIKTSVKIEASTDIAQIFQGQGGVNVDPSQLQGCIGKDLEAALNKIAGEYQSLSGYSAGQATAALNKISSDAQQAANAAAAQTKAAADAAYKQSKDAARDLASKSTSSAANAFKDAGNSISHAFGGKKHHSDANDKFDQTIFDWDYYYDTRGTAWGNTDLMQYWADQGYAAGERASFEFDLKFFRTQHPGANDKDLLNYWLKDGIDRCVQSSPDFHLGALVQRNPGGSCRENLDWWYQQGGRSSGLNASP